MADPRSTDPDAASEAAQDEAVREMDYPSSEDAMANPDRVVRGLDFEGNAPSSPRGLGPDSGGQSGDTAYLPRTELAESESVEELIEEGQYFEAGIVEGIENAPPADQGPIRTREVPEDDVPLEYLNDEDVSRTIP